MLKFLQRKQLVSIEHGVWYYFSWELDFEEFVAFSFARYIDVNADRKAAIVSFLEKYHFPTRDLLLLPYTRKRDFFRARSGEILAVWTFDASGIGDAETIDLVSAWPKNILDKGAITASIEVARKWTKGNKPYRFGSR